jgi:hypothetical protein
LAARAYEDHFGPQGIGLRRLSSLTFAGLIFAGTLFFAVGSLQAQTDIAVGGSIVWSPKNPNASIAYNPPPLKGGDYPMASAQTLLTDRWGVNVEGAFRYHDGLYDGFQKFRPIFYDANAVYERKTPHKTKLDLMAGIGGETLIFYNQYVSCNNSTGACRSFTNDNHFLLHLGGGVSYNFWRKFFVRPEGHYSYIVDNFEFHSHNLFRAGVSIGYTFGSSSSSPPAKSPSK